MPSATITSQLCVTLASKDGRSDWLKKAFILAVREAIDIKDAAISLRMIMSADWRRQTYHYGDIRFNITDIDFAQVATRFWKLWRRKAQEYFMTYVQYTTKFFTKVVNEEPQTWTQMFIYVADTRTRLRTYSTNIGWRRDDISPIYTFVEDKQTVLQFIKNHAKIVSKDARIEVEIYGAYGNHRRNSASERFIYLYEGNP